MWLDWPFALLTLPLAVAFALILGLGEVLTRRGWRRAGSAVTTIGIGFGFLAAAAIVWGMAGPVVLALLPA